MDNGSMGRGLVRSFAHGLVVVQSGAEKVSGRRAKELQRQEMGEEGDCF